jgi:hypothetical protein
MDCVATLAMTTRHASAFPQHECPSDAKNVTLQIKRAQGAPDAPVAPAARMQTRNATGTPKHRHSLRNGFNGLSSCSPRCSGLVGHRHLAHTACRTEARHRQLARLDPSVGGSGPHDLAVRRGCFRRRAKRAEHPRRPSHPASNVRDDRDTSPLGGSGCGETIINFRKTEEKYFWREGWTGQIRLRLLAKSVFSGDRFWF